MALNNITAYMDDEGAYLQEPIDKSVILQPPTLIVLRDLEAVWAALNPHTVYSLMQINTNVP